MKIGVVTWFRDLNYGTILQALAMQEYLSKCNYKPYLINYVPNRKDTIKRKLNLIGRINRKIDYLSNNFYKKKYEKMLTIKKKKFFDAIDDNCNLTKKVDSSAEFLKIGKDFDAYICGSDQIWNPYWLDGRFYLDFVDKSKKRISYAPSFGVNSIEKEMNSKIDNYLRNFDSLSIREAQGKTIIEKINNNYKVKNVCDPVFLLTENDWIKIIEKNDHETLCEKYIFYYFLSYNSNHWKALKKFAKEKKLKIVGIPIVGRQFYAYKKSETIIDAGPFDFLNLIRNAEYVFTDSFHATSFSVLFNKQFFVFERFSPKEKYSQNSRVNSFMQKIDLSSNIVKYNSKRVYENHIDYELVNQKIKVFVDESKKYLKESIE